MKICKYEKTAIKYQKYYTFAKFHYFLNFEILPNDVQQLKFIYSEKATKFWGNLSYVVSVKSKVNISQNIVAFSEYINFNENVLT